MLRGRLDGVSCHHGPVHCGQPLAEVRKAVDVLFGDSNRVAAPLVLEQRPDATTASTTKEVDLAGADDAQQVPPHHLLAFEWLLVNKNNNLTLKERQQGVRVGAGQPPLLVHALTPCRSTNPPPNT